MKPSLITHLVITTIITLVGFFTLPVLTASISPAFSFALGIALGGIVISIIANRNPEAAPAKSATTATEGNGTTLYVGNLPYRANEQAVKEHFATAGSVLSVRLMRDRRTGKRKGYGFIEIASSDANKVIKTFNDQEFQERTLKVRLAKDKVE